MKEKQSWTVLRPNLSVKNIEIPSANRVIGDRLLAQTIHNTRYKNQSINDQ